MQYSYFKAFKNDIHVSISFSIHLKATAYRLDTFVSLKDILYPDKKVTTESFRNILMKGEKKRQTTFRKKNCNNVSHKVNTYLLTIRKLHRYRQSYYGIKK
jgi:hypothetical protein